MSIEPETLAMIMFATLFVTLFLGHPLAFSLGAVAFSPRQRRKEVMEHDIGYA